MQLALTLLLSLALIFPFTAAAEESAPAVKLGLLLPLSGEYADWGVRVQRGVEMALEDTSNRFELTVEDEGPCDVKRSVAGFKNLVEFKGIKLVIPGCLAGTKANGPLAAGKGVLILSPGLIDREVLERKYPLLNFGTVLTQEARYLAKMVSLSKVKKVGTIRWANAFGEEVNNALRVGLQELKIAMPEEEEATDQTQDFTPVLLRFKRLGVDGIIINSLGTQQILILMRQVRQLGITVPVFGNYIVESNLGGVDPNELTPLEGVRYTYPFNAAEDTLAKADFDHRYQKRYGKDQAPSANSYFIYDGLRLVDQAVSTCRRSGGSEELPACVRRQLANGELRGGISGDLRILPDGSSLRPYGFKSIQNGKFVWSERQVDL